MLLARARGGPNKRKREKTVVPGERWAFGRDELQGWEGYTRKGWRAARRTGRREGLPLHLLVERVLGLGLRQGVPVGCGSDERVIPRGRPASGGDARRRGRLADRQVRIRCTGAASVMKAIMRISAPQGRDRRAAWTRTYRASSMAHR